jgi:hypothetical protein
MSSTTDKDFVLPQLPANVLLDIARNESASREWRKAATKLLLEGGRKEARHIELAWFVKEIEQEAAAEKDVVAVVESAIEEELPSKGTAVVYPTVVREPFTIDPEDSDPCVGDPAPFPLSSDSYPKLSDQIEECQNTVTKIHEFHGIKRETQS